MTNLTEQEKAARVSLLRETMQLLAQSYMECEAELKELNRPAWIDAKTVLAEMAAREAAKRLCVKTMEPTPLPPGIRRVEWIGAAR